MRWRFKREVCAAAIACVVWITACGGGTALPSGDCWVALAYARDSNQVFFNTLCGSRGISIVDPGATSARKIPRAPYQQSLRLAVDPSGQRLIASSGTNHDLVNLDIQSGDEIATSVTWSSKLGEIVVSPDGEAAWVTFWDGPDSGLALFSIETMTPRAFIPLAGNPIGLDADQATGLLVTAPSDPGSVQLIDGVGLVESIAGETDGALDVAWIPNSGRVAVLEDQLNQIVLWDHDTMSVVTTFTTGDEPRQLAVSPDGSFLAVTEQTDGVVRIFNLVTLEEQSAWTVSDRPTAIVAGIDNQLFVGLAKTGAMIRMDATTGEINGRFE